MAKTRRRGAKSASSTPRERVYRKRRSRRSLGLLGLPAPANAKGDMLDIAAVAVGAIAGANGAGLLSSKVFNKGESSNKMKGMIAPGILTVVGAAGSTVLKNRMAKSVAKGLAVGAAFKLVEAGTTKNPMALLSGVDDYESRPLMLPGVGEIGQANLPELSHYSENEDAPVTSTGADYEYRMGTPSEVLSGDDDIIAY